MRPLRRLLPLAALLLAPPLAAQQGRITATTDIRSAPGGTVVGQLQGGTTWTTGTTRNGFTSVVIEAWVDASRFAAGVDSFPVTIGGSSNLRIREQPSLQGRILGQWRPGAGMTILRRQDTWARVRREAWVPSSAISVQAATRPAAQQPTTTANRPSTPAQTGNAASTTPPAGGRQTPAPAPAGSALGSAEPVQPVAAGALRTDREVPIRLGPSGQVLAMLDSGVVVTPQLRERGWVKVRVEGWVPESYFVPADTAYGATLSAADLRADPDGHRGKLVRWRVQIVGMQTADPLRRDMRENEPFLLAIGPEGEEATLYVTVPQGLVSEARAIPPLTFVILTARVRTGRSNPTGAPILELVSIAERQ